MRNLEKRRGREEQKQSPIGVIILFGFGFIAEHGVELAQSLFCPNNLAKYNRIKSGSTGMTLEGMKIPGGLDGASSAGGLSYTPPPLSRESVCWFLRFLRNSSSSPENSLVLFSPLTIPTTP